MDSYNTLALVSADLFKLEEAQSLITKAMKLSYNPITCLNGAHVFLKSRCFKKGWSLLEVRKDRKDHQIFFGKLNKNKEWHGEDIRGKTLLIATEQGYGDCIQHARFFHSQIKKLNCKIILSCREKLIEVMQANFPFIEVKGLDIITDNLINYDYYIMQGSFTYINNLTDKTIPLTEPYLKTPKRAYHQIGKYIKKTKNLKVGFAWEVSDVQAESYNYKKIPVEYFIDLFNIEGVDFYSIQPGMEEKDLRKFNKLPQLTLLGKHLDSFSETFAAIEHMDLFISPDTGTHHAAGALGKANWLVLPIQKCWRWFDYKDTNPWYSSGRLFSQKEAGDWTSPFNEISIKLREVASLHQKGMYKKRDKKIFFSRSKK